MNTTPTTRLEILHWMLEEPGRKAERQLTGGGNIWFECRFDKFGHYEEFSDARGWERQSIKATDVFRMLPESPPKRVPFEEVDTYIRKQMFDHGDVKSAIFIDQIRDLSHLVITEAVAQMKEELKK